VLRRTEDALAEEAVALRLERAVVDRLRLGDLARGPVADLLARGKPNANSVEIVDVDQLEIASFYESWCHNGCSFAERAGLAGEAGEGLRGLEFGDGAHYSSISRSMSST